MATTVRVTTGDWPAQVHGFPMDLREPVAGAEHQDLGRIEPHSSRTFVATESMDIQVRELPSAAELEGDDDGAE